MVTLVDSFNNFIALYYIQLSFHLPESVFDLEDDIVLSPSSRIGLDISSPYATNSSSEDNCTQVTNNSITTDKMTTLHLRTYGTACGCWRDPWTSETRDQWRWISQSSTEVYMSLSLHSLTCTDQLSRYLPPSHRNKESSEQGCCDVSFRN